MCGSGLGLHVHDVGGVQGWGDEYYRDFSSGVAAHAWEDEHHGLVANRGWGSLHQLGTG